jgi:hypothetical protein
MVSCCMIDKLENIFQVQVRKCTIRNGLQILIGRGHEKIPLNLVEIETVSFDCSLRVLFQVLVVF